MTDSCKIWQVTSNGMLNSVLGCCMDVRLAKPLGIEPTKLLPARSSNCREESSDSCHGMLPRNMFDRNRRILSDGWLDPIHEGIVSENLFSPRSRIIRFLHLLRARGNPPMRLMLARCTDSSDKLELVDTRTNPEKALFDKSKNNRCCKLHRQGGTCPDNWFSGRSKILRESLRQNDRGNPPAKLLFAKEMASNFLMPRYSTMPENMLLLMSKYRRFRSDETAAGTSPSSMLESRSTASSAVRLAISCGIFPMRLLQKRARSTRLVRFPMERGICPRIPLHVENLQACHSPVSRSPPGCGRTGCWCRDALTGAWSRCRSPAGCFWQWNCSAHGTS